MNFSSFFLYLPLSYFPLFPLISSLPIHTFFPFIYFTQFTSANDFWEKKKIKNPQTTFSFLFWIFCYLFLNEEIVFFPLLIVNIWHYSSESESWEWERMIACGFPVARGFGLLIVSTRYCLHSPQWTEIDVVASLGREQVCWVWLTHYKSGKAQFLPVPNRNGARILLFSITNRDMTTSPDAVA